MATAELPPPRSTDLPLEPEMHPLVQEQAADLATVGDAIGGVVLKGEHPRGWWIGFLAGFFLLQVLALAVCWLFYIGVGIWGINVPVAWASPSSTSFGGSASATPVHSSPPFCCSCTRNGRTSINRFSEAMTIFAVMCAGLFPLLHMGRPWFFYWLYPFPNVAGVYPQFRSPLTWDVFAVTTYFTVSLVFWYLGLRARPRRASRSSTQAAGSGSSTGCSLLGCAALRFTGGVTKKVYLILGGISTPLVLSVHTVVSFDFAVSDRSAVARDHFPAVLRGRGGLLRFRDGGGGRSPVRKWYKLEDFFTDHHMDHHG